MRIFFLHGLESNNQSSKVDCMRELGHEVIAPEMNYKSNKLLFNNTLNEIMQMKPELIVGSSMGGYFAYHLGTHFSTSLFLLNPALLTRTFNPPILKDGNETSNIWALVGKYDDIVPAEENIEFLKSIDAKIEIGNHKHRTPRDVFEPVFNLVVEQMTSNN